MTINQSDTLDVAGMGSAITSVTLKVADWLGILDLNSIIVTITGVFGMIYLFYKIKMIRLEYKEKIKKRKS